MPKGTDWQRVMNIATGAAVIFGLLGFAGLYLTGFGKSPFGQEEFSVVLWPVALIVEAFLVSLVALYATIRVYRDKC